MCAAAKVPVLAQGGNTSLCGGATPNEDGPAPVIINLQRMRKIRAIDTASNTMTVDAGCVLAAIMQAAIKKNRLFPVSLGAEGSCQVGGAIATNAGGTGVLRYGNMRENILGIEAVLPDGAIWDGLHALRKNNTGYDLKHLFIGSEGTLGIVTGAVLKLHPLPHARAMAWLGVESPAAALDILALFREREETRLTAFELMNATQVDLVVQHVPDRRCPLKQPAPWHLQIELSDSGSPEALAAAMESALECAFDRGLIMDAVLAASEAQRSAMWEFRHSVSEANKKSGIGLNTDCAVPVSAVPAFIEQATAAVQANRSGTRIIVVAHMGDGNAHFIPHLDFESWAALPERDAFVTRVKHAIDDVAVRLGGTFSAEHGIGRMLIGEMARYKSPAEMALMQAVKRAIDPYNLFNPGRLLPPAKT